MIPFFFFYKTQGTQLLDSGGGWKTKFATCYTMNKQINMIFFNVSTYDHKKELTCAVPD